MRDVRFGRSLVSGRNLLLFAAALAIPIGALAAPKIGGVGTMQGYRFRHVSSETMRPHNGLARTIRSGDLKNGGDDHVIGPMQILDVRNTNRAPICFRVHVSDHGGDGQVEGDGRTWWIGRGQTLRNVASVHTLQRYQCRDRICSVRMGVRMETWTPPARRRC